MMINRFDCSDWKIDDIMIRDGRLAIIILDSRFSISHYYLKEIDVLMFIGGTKDLCFADPFHIIDSKTISI